MGGQRLASLKEDYVRELTEDEPEWLASVRKNSFSYYQSLDSEVSPLYSKYSGVSALKPDEITISSDSHSDVIFSALEPRIEEAKNGICGVNVGNQLKFLSIPDELKKKGLIIETIRDALKNHEQIVKDFFVNRVNPREDKFLALECSLFNSGLFVYVPKNTLIDQPITIINSLSDDGLSSVARNIFYVDEGSKAGMIQELYAPPEVDQNGQQAYFELLDTHVGKNASLELVTLQAMGSENMHVSNRKAFVERDGKIDWYIGAFGCGLSRYKIDNILAGEGAYAEHSDIIMGNRNQAFDITADLTHLTPNTKGRVSAKSVLKDNSKSLFKGMIKINKNAKSSESYLAGHAILLDKGAKSDSIPGLEIETNEVKATHSASVSQIDEDQLFYLMARCFTKSAAVRMIVDGFLEPLARRMSPRVRAWINYLIDSKWEGRPLILKTDELMREMIEVEEARVVDTDIFEKHYKYR